jgi:malonyl-CoA O-methyltransferase
LVVIDNNAEHWGRLETPEWERWFGREELAGMLRRHCREVWVEEISYWEDVKPDGLFLCWRAVK